MVFRSENAVLSRAEINLGSSICVGEGPGAVAELGSWDHRSACRSEDGSAFLPLWLLFSTWMLLKQRESIFKGRMHLIPPEAPLKASHRFPGRVVLEPSEHRRISSSFVPCRYYHVEQHRLPQWGQMRTACLARYFTKIEWRNTEPQISPRR